MFFEICCANSPFFTPLAACFTMFFARIDWGWVLGGWVGRGWLKKRSDSLRFNVDVAMPRSQLTAGNSYTFFATLVTFYGKFY